MNQDEIIFKTEAKIQKITDHFVSIKTPLDSWNIPKAIFDDHLLFIDQKINYSIRKRTDNNTRYHYVEIIDWTPTKRSSLTTLSEFAKGLIKNYLR